MKLKKCKTKKVKFTIVELLVVIAIITILASLLFPGLGKARALTKRTACSSNQRQMGVALLMYVNDFNGYSPAPYHGAGYSYSYWAYNLYGNGYLGEPATSSSSAAYEKAYKKVLCPAMPPFTSSGYGWGNTYGMCGLQGAGLDYAWLPVGTSKAGYIVGRVRIPSQAGWIVDSWDNSMVDQIYALNFNFSNAGLKTDYGFALAHIKTGNMLMLDGHIKNWKKDDIDRFNAQVSSSAFGFIPYIYPQF